jgi:phage major head subunit gpT-like protein
LTARLRSEFWESWNQVAKPAQWEEVTTILPSTTSIENYLNANPVPGFQLWQGMRNYGQLSTFVFQVKNQTFHADFLATLEDVDDDQTGLLMQQPKFLVEKAKLFPGRMVDKLLGRAIGAVLPQTGPQIGLTIAFDGLPFFSNRTASTTNAFGVGNNLIDYTSTGSGDGLTYNLVALYYASPVLKPLCWQHRAGPDFETNSGSPMSKEQRVVSWWCDLRGAPFFGYWFNAVGVNITNTPNVADMHAIYSAINAAFRTFQYPKIVATEDGEYVHEQTVFDSSNLCIVASTYLSEQVRQSIMKDLIPQNIGNNTVATENTFKGYAKWYVSRFMDNF